MSTGILSSAVTEYMEYAFEDSVDAKEMSELWMELIMIYTILLQVVVIPYIPQENSTETGENPGGGNSTETGENLGGGIGNGSGDTGNGPGGSGDGGSGTGSESGGSGNGGIVNIREGDAQVLDPVAVDVVIDGLG